MANWFEVRAGTMTEAEARAYFGSPTIRSRQQPGEGGDAIAALMKQPGDSQWGVDGSPRLPVPADRDR